MPTQIHIYLRMYVKKNMNRKRLNETFSSFKFIKYKNRKVNINNLTFQFEQFKIILNIYLIIFAKIETQEKKGKIYFTRYRKIEHPY